MKCNENMTLMKSDVTVTILIEVECIRDGYLKNKNIFEINHTCTISLKKENIH